jgi:outer membrane murein-binding lipoprotein Lpp
MRRAAFRAPAAAESASRVLRYRLLAAVAACVALAGCGTSAKPDQAQPGAEGRELSATDLATVANAYKTVRDRCDGLAGVRATDGAASALVRVYRANSPDALADFNDADRSLNLRATLQRAAGEMRRCEAPDAAARVLAVTGS